MLNDLTIIGTGALALLLAVINVAYAVFSGNHSRYIILARGLICGYIGAVYLAFMFGQIEEPLTMRYLMRGSVAIMLMFLAMDTIRMWRKTAATQGKC